MLQRRSEGGKGGNSADHATSPAARDYKTHSSNWMQQDDKMNKHTVGGVRDGFPLSALTTASAVHQHCMTNLDAQPDVPTLLEHPSFSRTSQERRMYLSGSWH